MFWGILEVGCEWRHTGRGWQETASRVQEAICTNLVIVEPLEWQTVGVTPAFHANLLITLNILLMGNSVLQPHILLHRKYLATQGINLFYGTSLKRRYYSVGRPMGFLRDSFKPHLLCTCQYRGTGISDWKCLSLMDPVQSKEDPTAKLRIGRWVLFPSVVDSG